MIWRTATQTRSRQAIHPSERPALLNDAKRYLYKPAQRYILNMAYLRLTIEPIPAASRLASLSKLMPQGQWNQLRRAVYCRAGYRCQICGRERRLHCHEVWQYNERTGYQWLRGFQALCLDCHNVKHILFVRDSEKRAKLLQHFAAINRVSRQQAEDYLWAAHQRQEKLNQKQWIISFGDYNLRMPALKEVQQRRDFARLGRPCYHEPMNR